MVWLNHLCLESFARGAVGSRCESSGIQEAVRTKSTRAVSADNGRQLEPDQRSSRDAEGKGQDSATGVTGIPTDLTGAELFPDSETQLQDGSRVSTGLAMRLRLVRVSPGECLPFCELVWVGFRSCTASKHQNNYTVKPTINQHQFIFQ